MVRNAARRRSHSLLAAAAILALAVAAVYAPVRDFPFLGYDDEDFIVNNPLLARGLSLEGLRGAFTTAWFANWHPVAWMSHMVDIEIVGMDAGTHHVISVAYHAAAAAGLLVFLLEITGALGPSLLAAALWALHPLRVESVAWITERKDALSTLLLMLAVLAWLRARRRTGAGYPAAALALAALAAMAKPTTVTLPLCLLLLEAWPAGTAAAGRGRAPGGNSATAGGLKPPRRSRHPALAARTPQRGRAPAPGRAADRTGFGARSRQSRGSPRRLRAGRRGGGAAARCPAWTPGDCRRPGGLRAPRRSPVSEAR